MSSLEPPRRPATPRDAATVLVLREDQGALEVFCVRRHARSAFLGGAVVFPGGKLDEQDAQPAWTAHVSAPNARALEFADDEPHARALAICASRETLEEGGIVATLPPVGHREVAQLRARTSDPSSSTTLRAALAQRGWRLELAALEPFARWITPEVEPRRFDARFFLLPLPADQCGRHDERETTMSLWARPSELLTANQAGELSMAPPTVRALELLAPAAGLAEARALARRQRLEPVRPRFVPADPPLIVLPGDPLHSEPAALVDGATRFVLRDGTFVSCAKR
jgi:8-oxo-dGTP pyrophosphatase MutT (NUDIX family)